MNEKKKIGEPSYEAQLLEAHLAKADIGDLVSYDDLSEVLGQDVRKHAYGPLCTARRRLLRDEGIVFGTINSKGLKRLDNVEILEFGHRGLKRCSKTARKYAEILGKADTNEFDRAQLARLNADLAVYAGVTTLAKKAHQVEKHLSSGTGQINRLPVGKLLDLFK